MKPPPDLIVPREWEIQVGWNAQLNVSAVLLLFETLQQTTLAVALHPDTAHTIGESLVAAARKMRDEPPPPSGSQQ